MTQTPQPPRDWQKDMEMCKAATRGPWKIFAKGLETLIGTEYDHPQLQAPDSIVGHAYGVKGEYVYIRENDAKLLAEARTALPYWLQEAKERGEQEQRLKAAMERSLNTTDPYEMLREIETAYHALYPDTPEPEADPNAILERNGIDPTGWTWHTPAPKEVE